MFCASRSSHTLADLFLWFSVLHFSFTDTDRNKIRAKEKKKKKKAAS
jgi:hypothetical protein